MELNVGTRLKHAWNAFLNRDPTRYETSGYGYSSRPYGVTLSRGTDRSIVTSIFNRIALDVAAITINHCRLDGDGRYLKTIDSPLNSCLTLSANIDQTGRTLIHDIVLSTLDEGTVAVVPVYTDVDPNLHESYDIYALRVGKIVEWRPKKVKVRIYNDETSEKCEVWYFKKNVAIIENPLYAVVNEPNSTVQRLIRKLSLLDVTDERTASGKLDLIIQLPYTVKTQVRKDQADARRKSIEDQLAGSKYGIAYIDGTERITQLNRSVENQLMKQIEFLTAQVYSQLGITQSIMDGTADEKTMLNYNNQTIEPFVAAIVDEFKRKFLTKTARTQGQTIKAFRDPFRFVPVNDMAEIADKFTRNEIMSSNEIRQVIGMKPSNDPKADQLVNSNIAQPTEEVQSEKTENSDKTSDNKEKKSVKEE